jgi:two-component system, LytTR family, sensor kinase
MAERATRDARNNTYFISGVWLSWTAIAVVSFARHYFEDTHLFDWPNGSLPDFLSWLACFYPWAILTPSLFRFEERFPLSRSKWPRNLGIIFSGSLIFSYLALQIGTLMNFGINHAFGKPASLADFGWRVPLVVFCFEECTFWCALSAACAIRHFAQFHRQARHATQLALDKSQLETSLRQAELENLRIRLNPHFLFNALQNISVLAQQNPKLASQMLARLGDLLRAALRPNASLETTVEEEMALTHDYLAVEKMRFGDRLTILVDQAAGADQALVPSFLLQPLVENAIIHGLRATSQVGTIAIRAAIKSDRLILTVADNGVGVEWPGEINVGIGLSSTRERLAKLYPGDHQFIICKLDEGGTEVRIAIPYRRKNPSSQENVPSEQLATIDR